MRCCGMARRGLSLVETLVVIGIVAVLAALALPALQQVRESANRAGCFNNVRQIALASHQCQDSYGYLPPLYGTFTYRRATVFLSLLPFVEQAALFDRVRYHPMAYRDPASGLYDAGMGGSAAGGFGLKNNPVSTTRVGVYTCPSDATVFLLRDWEWWPGGNVTYAANFQAFGNLKAQVNGFWIRNGLAGQGKASLAAGFGDGTSHTILFAERYAYGLDLVARVARSNIWDHWNTFAEDSPGFAMRGLVGVPGNTDQLEGPASKFQVQPLYRPIPGHPNNHDWRRPQTAHAAGMNVAMADGSARAISASVGAATWWAACTADAGDRLGTDW